MCVPHGRRSTNSLGYTACIRATLYIPAVPKIHWDLSTKRVLTMDFAEGGQVNDRDYMRTHGINVNETPNSNLSLSLYAQASVRLTDRTPTGPPQSSYDVGGGSFSALQ
ncbi:hypothetical protein NFI96_005876 [Prochilodus magdalenae]|nr:hypothetical protein NFI96_005876 [Prochilodus magdalenae]